jgi:beta-galactosidase
MRPWSRRDVLKSGVAIPAATAAGVPGMAVPAESAQSGQDVESNGKSPALRERLLLDFGWRFHFGHANDAAKDFGFGAGRSGGFLKTGGFLTASSLAFDDSEWKPVDLPHDWAIELPFQNDPALTSKGSYPLGRDYPETSVGWYRRVFELPASDVGRRISMEFDGAYRETMVVFNGFYVGRHSGGYDPFSFDVSDFASPGGPNVLLVRVDATLSDGWFYEGAGLYRHVWLVKTAPVHVKKWGTLARAEVRPGEARVSIRTEVANRAKGGQSVRVISTILDPAGKQAGKAASGAQSIADAGEGTFEQQVTVRQPALWSLEERNLYRLVTEVESGGAVVDRYETRFGVRSLRFDPEKGFLLNGQPVKVKGTCNHQDHAGLGVALPDAAQYYRVRKLKEMGCNAIRTSHNPPTPELLDACDELGMLVMDETRMLSSNPEGIAQFEHMIRRDRNHPSVILWSMGNEEMISATEVGLRLLTSMKQAALKQDDSRPITIAPPPMGTSMGKGGLAVCDVMGYNYADPQAEAYHKANPNVPVLGTENVSAVGTRGVYVTDPAKGYVGSYDPYTTTGRASAEGWWRFVNARPWVAGGFVWTGFDYRGEPSPYGWPNIGSQYGVIDLCGFPKDTFFYYQSWWTGKPVLHLFPHWNWPGLEGQEIAVWVHTNVERVELFHNGRSLGAKDVPRDSHVAWNVKYAAGSIEARGFQDGRQVMTAKRETTGPAAKLVLRTDRTEIAADGEDLAMFTVEVQDAQGRIVPVTDNEVAFKVTGPGRLAGVGNGDPTSHESDIGSSRRAFSGLCMAIVQATKSAGDVTVEATSPGLTGATATVGSKRVRLRPQVAVWARAVPSGEGVTGLWRPVVQTGAASPQDLMSLLFGGGDMVFTLRQQGDVITGEVEVSGGGGFFGSPGGAIEDGRVDGGAITFRAGNTTYTGTVSGERIELKRTMAPFRLPGAASAQAAGPRPAVGPPPDGTDPSFGAGLGGRRGADAAPLVLRRVTR